MDNGVSRLAELISSSSRIVFFGGAGVSTESGIPDFRSEDGIFSAIKKYGYPPEELLSHSFFARKPDIFYRYYKELLMSTEAKPNDAHIALARLEQMGKLSAVVTQNIDGLHQKAGSMKVFELHGSIHRNYCTKCRRFFDAEYVKSHNGIPYCPCGGIIKPDVVLYEEPLDASVMRGAANHIHNADMLIIGGTSLQVYPAAGFIDYYFDSKLVLVNMSRTPYDGRADLVIHAPIGQVFRRIMEDL